MKQRAYVETSVVSYLTARASLDVVVLANRQIIREWRHDATSRLELVVSPLVTEEAGAGDPEAARDRLAALEPATLVEATDDARALMQRLVESGAIPEKARPDAAHIAVAATNGVHYLVTWNLRHIANAFMRARIEQACRDSGYAAPAICTPRELMEDDNGQDG